MHHHHLVSFIGFISIIVLLPLSNLSLAADDAAGSKDYPLFSRYPGSTIRDYYETDYDEYQFVTAPLKDGKLISQKVEGKYITIVYRLPNNLSTLQVFKNYEQAFNKAAVKQVLSCNQTTCGGSLPFTFQHGQGESKSARYLGLDTYINDDYRFWTGVIEKGNAKTFVTFYVVKSVNGVGVLLDIIEPKTMETGLVKVDFNSLDAAIKTSGKAVLDGIFFDNDKATIKPESKESLKVIADYLKSRSKVNAFVVGHTDNSGDYKHNLALSQQRADAVVQTLVKDYKIDAGRLTPAGIGPVSPAGSNTDDAGKSRNRRVELVLK